MPQSPRTCTERAGLDGADEPSDISAEPQPDQGGVRTRRRIAGDNIVHFEYGRHDRSETEDNNEARAHTRFVTAARRGRKCRGLPNDSVLIIPRSKSCGYDK